jgi:hypothetical protein
LLPPPSTGGCPPSAASTASAISTGRIVSNPAQYVRRPKVHPNDARGLDRSELGSLLFAAERVDHAHAALAVLLGLNGLRVSEACSADMRTSDSSGATGHCASSAGATSRQSSRGAQDSPDDRPGDRGTHDPADPAPPRWQSARPAHRAPMGSLDRQASRARPCPPSHAAGRVHHLRPRGRGPAARGPDLLPATPTRGRRLRQPSPEFRQACGVRRGRIRGG